MSKRTSLNIGSSLRLMAVMVLWAACFPLITIGLDLVPHLAFAALRAALAGLCLIALGVLCGRSIPVGGRSWVLIVVVGLGSTSMGFLGMFHATEFVSPGLATVIANVQPIIAAVLAYVFLGERLSTIGKIVLAVGLAGIAVIAPARPCRKPPPWLLPRDRLCRTRRDWCLRGQCRHQAPHWPG